jgi:hypothetical protein
MTPYPRGRICSVQNRRPLSLDAKSRSAVHVPPVTLPALGDPDLARRRPWLRPLVAAPRACWSPSMAPFCWSGCAVTQPLDQAAKPGQYQAKLAHDAPLCHPIQDRINTNIDAEGKIHFSAYAGFLPWTVVKGAAKALRDPAPGDVFEMVVDVDNDGIPDHIFKQILSRSGRNVDYLFVFSAERGR